MKNRFGNKERVLNYILDNGSITTWEAIREFGITRLSDCIYRLRRRGYFIDNEWVESTNRYGDSVRFVRYTLDKEKTFDFQLKLDGGINTPNISEKA